MCQIKTSKNNIIDKKKSNVCMCVCFCLAVSISGQLWDTINCQYILHYGHQRRIPHQRQNIFSQITAENLLNLQKDVHVGQAMYLSPDTQYKERYSQPQSVFKHWKHRINKDFKRWKRESSSHLQWWVYENFNQLFDRLLKPEKSRNIYSLVQLNTTLNPEYYA